MKSATIKDTKPKVKGGISTPKKKEVSGISPRKVFQGSPRKIKGPLRQGQKPIKCYRYDGWGDGWRECPTSENLNWRELVGVIVPLLWKSWLHFCTNPKSKSMIYKPLRWNDLFHDLVPLYQLVGEVNETTVW